MEEIKLIDIKAMSREKRDLILDEMASLKYLNNKISKINHMFASKFKQYIKEDIKIRNTLNNTFTSSMVINNDYLLDIFYGLGIHFI